MSKNPTRRQFSAEFKRDAVDLTQQPGRTSTDVAYQLGILPALLQRWRWEARARGELAFPEAGKQALSEENLKHLARLPLKTDERSGLNHQETVLQLAREHQLSADDATYLELTLRLQATLATFDRKLALATNQAGSIIFDS